MTGAWINRHGLVVERGDQWCGPASVMRYRHYLADALFYVTATFAEGSPSEDDIERGLRCHRRVPFLGRRPCIPSMPIFIGCVEAPSLVEALLAIPANESKRMRGRWPIGEGPEGQEIALTEDRDWDNDIHVGERRMLEGMLEVA